MSWAVPQGSLVIGVATPLRARTGACPYQSRLCCHALRGSATPDLGTQTSFRAVLDRVILSLDPGSVCDGLGADAEWRKYPVLDASYMLKAHGHQAPKYH